MNEKIDQYKAAMANMASSVSILTLLNGDDIAGMTVSSASSFSANPPIIMAAVNANSSFVSKILDHSLLTMNLLSRLDENLARVFSGDFGEKGADRFLVGEWDMALDHAPILKSSLSSFSGRLLKKVAHGSHIILLVEIDQVIARMGAPLVYHNRGYKTDF